MNAIVKTNPASSILRPQTFADLVQFANIAAKSSMVPPQYKSQPENIIIAVQLGDELGLAPMQSLQNIAVVNGRPTVWGDAVIGLCRQSPVCKDIVETVTGEGDKQVATCTAIRVGSEPVVRSFSVDDAKKAGLWGKSGPWQQYPKRMLQMRARGFAVRDAFPDVLRGLITAEEAADIPGSFDRPHALDTFRGTTLDADPPPAAPSVPEAPRRQTPGEWLDALELELAACRDADEVDAVLARPSVQAAQDRARGEIKDRLDGMLHAAIARTADDSTAPNDELYAPGQDPFRQPETVP